MLFRSVPIVLNDIENKKFSSKIGTITVSYGRNIKSLMKMDPSTFLGHVAPTSREYKVEHQELPIYCYKM